MPRLLLLVALASFSLAAAAQHDASRQKTEPQKEDSASGSREAEEAR